MDDLILPTWVGYCLTFLGVLVPIIQHIVIEHGCSDDWPELFIHRYADLHFDVPGSAGKG